MLVFTRQPNGTWAKTGDLLPTETHYTIAIDADPPAAKVYTTAAAIAHVESLIAKGETGSAYRYELNMPPSSMLRMKPATRVAAKSTHKGETTVQAKPEKHKAALKPVKKETGHQRRERLKAGGICTACGKRKAQPKPKEKGGGFYPECRQCREYFAKWAKEHGKTKKGGKQ